MKVNSVNIKYNNTAFKSNVLKTPVINRIINNDDYSERALQALDKLENDGNNYKIVISKYHNAYPEDGSDCFVVKSYPYNKEIYSYDFQQGQCMYKIDRNEAESGTELLEAISDKNSEEYYELFNTY